MGPKKNMKAEAAKETKQAAQDAANAKAAKDAEDAFWKSAGEGAKGKGAAKKEAEEAKRAEQLARKAELKRLAEAEEAAAASKPKSSTKANRVSGPKVTHHELDRLREQEAADRSAEAAGRSMAARREVSASEYRALVDTDNVNRQEDVVDARSLEQAIGALQSLGVGAESGPAADKHPEKRMRAAWKAYEEHNLPLLRMEKPNLKVSQYREMLWKQWQKAPENPINQAAAAGQ